jgi:hypothetical protein
MEEEIIVKKRYSIPYDMFGNAFTVFQKKFVYPRNTVMSIILLVAAAANVVNIVSGNGSTMGYVLIFACLGLAFVNWYNPKKLKRNLMESIKGIENDVYELTLMPDKLIIGTVLEPLEGEENPKEEYEQVFDETPVKEEIAETEIFLTKDVVVIEKSEYFMVYLKRAMFYVIPKKDFSEEEVTIMQIHFQKQLDDKNYMKYEK